MAQDSNGLGDLLRLLEAQQQGDTAGMERIRSRMSGRDIEDVLTAAFGELTDRLVDEIEGGA